MDSRAQRSAEGEAATPDNPHGWPVRNVAMPLCDPAGHCIARRPGSNLSPMNNACHFSTDRRYRYALEHVLDPLLQDRPAPLRVMWIGLNPSTADEQKLDPTLRRIRAFSAAWGYTSFIMTNLFAFRATDPEDMMAALDPVGPENDAALATWAAQCDLIVAAWGVHGTFRKRHTDVMGGVLRGFELHRLEETKDGHPKHPLYVHGKTLPALYKSRA